MKRTVYDDVVNFIHAQRWHFDNCLLALERAFPQEHPRTLRSILGQEYQKVIKKRFPVYNTPHKKAEIYREYRSLIKLQSERDPIGKLCTKLHFSPFLTARIILEEHIKAQPHLYLDEGASVTKYLVNQLAKNPNLVLDPELATHIKWSIHADPLYGPVVEGIKQAVGIEHEIRLQRELRELDLDFEDENYFRKVGCDKTPDVKLVVPFSVGPNIVNWVESKALFGDHESHATYMKNQLYSYWNRFGPGMVIYWFGFVDDLNTKKHQGILVCDNLPLKNISPLELEFKWDVDAWLEQEDEREQPDSETLIAERLNQIQL